jgi:hypothetical protein
MVGYKHGMRWLLLVAIVGCADNAPPREAAPPPAPTALPSPPAEPSLTVRLISAGAEPRRVLRFRPRVGDERVTSTDMSLEMAMNLGPHRMFAQKLTTRGSFAMRAIGVESESGEITYELTVIEIENPEFGPQRGDEKPTDLRGKKGTFKVSERGVLVSVDLPFLETHGDPAGFFHLTDWLVALPVEAVGVGAVWSLEYVSLRNGLSIDVVETHTLVALDGTTGRTTYTHTQSTEPQLVPAFAQRDPFSVFEMVSTTSTGSGELELSLDRPFPSAYTMKFGFDSKMRMRRPEGPQDITMTMSADMKSVSK